MSIRRFRKEVEALENARHPREPEDEAEREEERKHIREQAEHSNYCNEGRGEETFFEIDESGDVFCSRDGRPVTAARQIIAEAFYWMEVGWGPSPRLVHDEEAQAFYTKSGKLALSRDFVNLEHLMGTERHESWPPEG